MPLVLGDMYGLTFLRDLRRARDRSLRYGSTACVERSVVVDPYMSMGGTSSGLRLRPGEVSRSFVL